MLFDPGLKRTLPLARRERADETLAEFVVTVVDETGAPLEGAMVTYAAEATILPEIAFRTNAKGKSKIDLPIGGVRAFAHYGGTSESVSGQLSTSGLELQIVIPSQD